MKKSNAPLLIALAIILGIFVLLNELGRKADTPSSVRAGLRSYANPALGFGLSLPDGWALNAGLDAQGQSLMANLDIVELPDRARVAFRATRLPWEYFEPLAVPASSQREDILFDSKEGHWAPIGGRGLIYATVERDSVLFEVFGPDAAVHTVLAGFRWLSQAETRSAALSFARPSPLPGVVRQWRNTCQALDLSAFGSVLHADGRTFIYVGSGKRPTGGYSSTILKILRTGESEVSVFARFTRPAPGAIVTQAYSTPSDLVEIEPGTMRARFFALGNDAPPVISVLQGIDSLRTIYDQSRTIKVFSPRPNTVVSGSVLVSGIVHAGVERLYLRTLNSLEEILEKKSLQLNASPHWMFFEDTLSLGTSSSPGDSVALELYTIDDASGDVVDQLRVPLRSR